MRFASASRLMPRLRAFAQADPDISQILSAAHTHGDFAVYPARHAKRPPVEAFLSWPHREASRG